MTISVTNVSLGNLGQPGIRTEFAPASGTPVSLYAFRRGGPYVSAGQGNAGYGLISAATPVGMGPFRNQSAQFVFNDIVSSSLNIYNLRNRAVAAGWNGTSQLIATITVNSGVYIYSSNPGLLSFTLGTPAPPAGSTVTLTNNGIIAGGGGLGGNGGNAINGVSSQGSNGGVGGTAFSANYAISVYNYGTIGGGGGGGGGGSSQGYYVPGGVDPKTGPYAAIAQGATGGGGGGGAAFGNNGAPGTNSGNVNGSWPGSFGATGTLLVGGAGGAGNGHGPTGPDSGDGGAGGALGQAGSPGQLYTNGEYTTISNPTSGGAAGAAIVGGANIIWYIQGTRLGSIDNPGNTSNIIGSVLSGGSGIYNDADGITSAGLSFLSNGDVTANSGGGLTPSWWTVAPVAGIGNSYWIRVTATGSGGTFSGTLGTWLQLSSTRSWSLSNPNVATIKTRTLTISIASDAAGTNILATYTNCQLIADYYA